MKSILLFILLCIIEFSYSQVIPIGRSDDTITFIHDSLIPSARSTWFIAYNKPANYDPATSDIVIYFHGQGGSEREGIFLTQTMCNRRGALFVGLNDRWGAWTNPWDYYDINYGQEEWMVTFPPMMEKLYKYILQREGRDSANVRILGFSAGGQFVTRYMLIRQGVPDNIPIKMGISINPYYYTFPTKVYNGVDFTWQSLCGLKDNGFDWYAAYGIISHEYYGIQCEEHIKGYYNENYTVMIGDLDTATLGDTWCAAEQGRNRLERAQNFYAFCLQDATERGMDLQWNYVEVPGIPHDGHGMINKLMPDEGISYCEHYLFDMPYHEPIKYKPTAEFNYTFNDSTKCYEFNADSECWWQTVPTHFLWDMGNGYTDTNHFCNYNFTKNGVYDVKYKIWNQYGSDSITKRITVTNFPNAEFYIFDSITYLPNNHVSFSMDLVFPDEEYMWYFGDNTSTYYTTPSHNYNSAGRYAVSLVKTKGICVDSITKYVTVYDTTTNVYNISNKITVYQKSDNLIVCKSNVGEIHCIELIAVDGKIVYKTTNEIARDYFIIPNIKQGVYSCVLTTASGRHVVQTVIQ